jgi:hypothetical protein
MRLFITATLIKQLKKFDPDDALSIITAQEVMGERRVEANLAFIKSNFSFLSSALISRRKGEISIKFSCHYKRRFRKIINCSFISSR